MSLKAHMEQFCEDAEAVLLIDESDLSILGKYNLMFEVSGDLLENLDLDLPDIFPDSHVVEQYVIAVQFQYEEYTKILEGLKSKEKEV